MAEQKQPRRPLKIRKFGGIIGLLQSVAGNATTETVIMIPVLVVLWGGIWYTHGRYRKAVNMAQYTRAHIWQHAFASCEGSPPGRTTISTGGFSGDGFIGGATDLLFGGVLRRFQIDEVEARRDTSIDRPTVLGSGSVGMEHHMWVMCNETIQEDGNWVEAVFGTFI